MVEVATCECRTSFSTTAAVRVYEPPPGRSSSSTRASTTQVSSGSGNRVASPTSGVAAGARSI
ncbi:MAG TPA: hypothetical protein VGV85_15840, partial [Longimicrobiaceae bacterium]|nr:hypothetical protein [Longimicrobiaceae bacterium]